MSEDVPPPSWPPPRMPQSPPPAPPRGSNPYGSNPYGAPPSPQAAQTTPPSVPTYPPPPQYPPPAQYTRPAPYVQRPPYGQNPPQPAQPSPAPEGNKSYIATLLLAYFFGVFGIDRFYLGKVGTGLLKLFTIGGYGLWWLIDVLLTLFGAQRDKRGMQLAGYNKYKKSVGIIVGAIFGAALTLNVIIDAFRGTLSTTPTDTWGQLLVLFIIAGAVSATVLGVRRHRRTRTAKATRTARDAEPVPERIQSRIAKLAGLKTLYDARATTGDQDAAAIASAIAALVTDVPELFRRLRLKADRNERTNATIEYDNTLEKLSAALDRDYLLDVLANPRLWDAAPQRIRGVQDALDAVNKQVVRNIQQVNSRRSMVFEVALDGLTGSRKDMDDWQRDFDQASGDTG